MPESQRKEGQPQNLTRARLIDVATQEFSMNGFAGARVDKIVRQSGVSKNALYYYFESKEVLFVEVMEHAYTRMRSYQNEWTFAKLEPEDAISRLTTDTFHYFLEEPGIISLLNTENLHQAKHIAMSKQIPKLYNPLLSTIEDILARGHAKGVFRDDIDAVDLYITISGLGYFYLSNQYTLSHVLEQDLLEPTRLRQRERHMVAVVLGYLRDKAAV